jgi:hypothetical protein
VSGIKSSALRKIFSLNRRSHALSHLYQIPSWRHKEIPKCYIHRSVFRRRAGKITLSSWKKRTGVNWSLFTRIKCWILYLAHDNQLNFRI